MAMQARALGPPRPITAANADAACRGGGEGGGWGGGMIKYSPWRQKLLVYAVKKHQGGAPVSHLAQRVVECGDSGASLVQYLETHRGVKSRMRNTLAEERLERAAAAAAAYRSNGLDKNVEFSSASKLFEDIQIDRHSC